MILHPRFYGLPALDRAAERAKLGLDPERPTGIVLFGGYGSPAMLDIQRRLAKAGLDVQLIFIAGRNERLRAALEAGAAGRAQHVTGFTTEIPYYMRLADFFIGKPGPGSLSEALHLGLPAITVRNAWTLPQERFNAEWLERNGTGLVLRSFREIAAAVRTLLEPGRLAAMRAAAAARENRALFEIPPVLARLAGAV
jgi:1,2-diacylglycerol 3-beta-galactosyltransferase